MSAEFFEAIKQGNLEEVQRLLSLNPKLIQVKEGGLSPIMIAAYHQQTQIADLLAERVVTMSIFEAAATGRMIHIIRLLAKDPELVNAYSEDGFQPLGLACFFGHYEAADYLIKAGAAINSQSRNGLRAAPIQSAAAAGHKKIVTLLIEEGADPNIREAGGYTPLHAAAQNGDLDMIHALLFGGADPHIKSNSGKTPLDFAQEAKHPEAVDLLNATLTRRFRIKR